MRLPSAIINDQAGLHYAVRIFFGTVILSLLLEGFIHVSPLWAIISLIVVTEPQINLAWLAFRSRMVHTFIGCMTGFLFLMLLGTKSWLLPLALTFTVLVSTYFSRMPTGWRIGPITTALIMSAGMVHQSSMSGLEAAVQRTLEVLLGSAMALAVSWAVSLVWAPVDAVAGNEKRS